MKNWLLLVFFLCSVSIGFSQHRLSGLWEGTLTRGGIYAKDGYKFELLIEIEGNEVKGRSYIYLDKGEVIEMDLSGKLYSDRSVYFEDIEFISQEGSEVFPPFNRKYQLVYSRSIWENTLEGYWQEIRSEVFDEKRKRGRIFLKKVGGNKA